MLDFCKQCPQGMVYIMTNASECNEVASFFRQPDGTLSPCALYGTGGRGTGPDPAVDPLGSQGSLILTKDGRFLLAVNAGSGTVSCFMKTMDGTLILTDVQPSGGVFPNSIAVFGSTVYVANAGGSGKSANISGFRLDGCGRLSMIPGSTAALSQPDAKPAQVIFSPCGRQLIVSEVNVNRLTVYRLERDGTVTLQKVNGSYGAGPFGLAVLPGGLLIVAEAGAGALSSYMLYQNGDLYLISGSASTGQTATCWVTLSADGCIAYASNTGSGTISVFKIGENGMLSLANTVSSTLEGTPQGAPIDSGVSPDGCFFYVLNGNQGSVSAFSAAACTELPLLQTLHSPAIPTGGTQGLAVC